MKNTVFITIACVFMPLAILPNTGDPTSIKHLILRLSAAFIAAGFIIRGDLPSIIKKRIISAAVLCICFIIPALKSPDRSLSLIGIYPFYSSSLLTNLCAAVFFFGACCLEKKQTYRIFYVMLITSVFVSLYGIIQYAGFDFFKWNTSFGNRIFSAMGNPNFLAAYLSALIPAVVALYLSKGGVAPVIVLIMDLSALLLTLSRGGIISAFFGVSVVIIIMKRTQLINKRIIHLIIISVSAFFLLLLLSPEVINNAGKRYLSAFNLEEENINSRFIQWNTAVEMILEKPVTGWGVNAYHTQFRKKMDSEFVLNTGNLAVPGYPHNLLLELFVNGGILFSIPLILAAIGFVMFVYRKKDEIGFMSAAFTGCSSAVFLMNLFSFSVAVVSVIVCILAGCCMSYINDDNKITNIKSSIRYIFILPVVWFIVFSINRFWADISFFKRDYPSAVMKAPEIAKYRMFYGKSLYLGGNYEEAEKIFKDQIMKTPYNALAYNGLGSVLKKRGRYNEAMNNFNKALENDPFLSDALVKLADIYRDNGDYDNALINYEKALEIDPGLSEPRYNLGVLFFKKGMYSRAKEEWGRIIEKNPSHKKALKGIMIIDGKKFEKNQ